MAAAALEAADAEGLALVTAATNPSGYKGVCWTRGKYHAQIYEGGKRVFLGYFLTAQEAALAYARRIGPERAAEEAAAAARIEVPLPLTAAEVLAAVAAEHLELVTAPNSSGYKRVCWSKGKSKYQAQIYESGKLIHLGTFVTAEEAALAYARRVGPERAAAEAAAARGEGPKPLTADEALAAAEAEGLELVTAANSTGFKGVYLHEGKCQAKLSEGGKLVHLGMFVTAEEAALCVARYVRGLVDDWLIPGRRATSGGQSSKAKRKRVASSSPGTSATDEEQEARDLWLGRPQMNQPATSSSTGGGAGASSSSSSRSVDVSDPQIAITLPLSSVRGWVRVTPEANPWLDDSDDCSGISVTDDWSGTNAETSADEEDGDEGETERCAICLEGIDIDGPEPSARDPNAWGHAPCCANYFHRRCLAIWFHGGGESGDNQVMQKGCPTCRRKGWTSRGLVLGRVAS